VYQQNIKTRFVLLFLMGYLYELNNLQDLKQIHFCTMFNCVYGLSDNSFILYNYEVMFGRYQLVNVISPCVPILI